MDGIFELVAAYSYAAHAYQAVHGPTAYPKPGTSFILAFQNGLLVMEHQETGVQYYAYCCNTYLRLLKGDILLPYAIGDALATHNAHYKHAIEISSVQVWTKQSHKSSSERAECKFIILSLPCFLRICRDVRVV